MSNRKLGHVGPTNYVPSPPSPTDEADHQRAYREHTAWAKVARDAGNHDVADHHESVAKIYARAGQRASVSPSTPVTPSPPMKNPFLEGAINSVAIKPTTPAHKPASNPTKAPEFAGKTPPRRPPTGISF